MFALPGSSNPLSAAPRISVVTTMYCSEPYLREFHRRMTAALEQLTASYEIVYVNDGSPDGALGVALELRETSPRVKVIDLSRNFGHYKAILTGLAHTSGELVFLIDCDLEEDPALVLEFYDAVRKSGADSVFGVQRRRKGEAFERVSGAAFYGLFNALSDIKITPNLITARLMTQRYVQGVLAYQESEVFLAGIFELAGFKQITLEVDKKSKGTSTYDLKKKIDVLVNAVTSFSAKPLELIFYTGAAIVFFAAAFIAYLVSRKLVYGITVDGWTSVIVSIWFMGGLMILFMGIIAIYLSKVFQEAKRRPATIIRQVYETRESETANA